MKRNAPSKLWLCFVGAFALQLAAWTAWFVVASHHKVAEVPLANAGRAIPHPPPRSVPTSPAH